MFISIQVREEPFTGFFGTSGMAWNFLDSVTTNLVRLLTFQEVNHFLNRVNGKCHDK
jgi:hypothetical protein